MWKHVFFVSFVQKKFTLLRNSRYSCCIFRLPSGLPLLLCLLYTPLGLCLLVVRFFISAQALLAFTLLHSDSPLRRYSLQPGTLSTLIALSTASHQHPGFLSDATVQTATQSAAHQSSDAGAQQYYEMLGRGGWFFNLHLLTLSIR